ncbi:MAG: alpha/beta hydrolase [Myxococcota bacterium]
MTTLTAPQASQLFRDAPHDLIDVGEGAAAYRRVGAGPDVLFVHGWPASSATFRALLPFLTAHVTCHLVDLPGAGHSQFTRASTISVAQHIESVRRIVDALELEQYAVVAHDSGGMIARHALAGDPRMRAMVLVDTEQPQGLTWRFKQFLVMAHTPGFEHVLAWAANHKGLRKNKLLLGDAFADRSLLAGEFEEFFLAPLRDNPERRWAAGQLIKSFDTAHVYELAEIHQRITVPVQLVWGADDPFFPVEWAQEMVETFADATLRVVPGGKLFVHEEMPEDVSEVVLSAVCGDDLLG